MAIKPGVGADYATLSNSSLCGGNPCIPYIVDQKDGKYLRTRPLSIYENYTVEEQVPRWEVRHEESGRVYKSAAASEIVPFTLAYRQRYTSNNRILYPMKREDWSPENRNPQNRGKSKYVRISWDEAAELCAQEIKRQYEKYGPGSILAAGGGHGECHPISPAHGCQNTMWEILGGYCMDNRNPDSWEGWYWGAKHVWGQDPVGLGKQTNLFKDITNNTQTLVLWGCDPCTAPYGWGGQQPSRMMAWFKSLGKKVIAISPDLNYASAVYADRWIPVIPNSDLAMQYAIAYYWIVNDMYDKEYIDTHVIGFDYLKSECMGWGKDGIEKTPEWAEKICGVPARVIKAFARRWYKETLTTCHCSGGSYIRGPYAHEPARMEVCLLAMQGLGKPGRNQFRMIEWGHMGIQWNVPVPRSLTLLNVSGCYNAPPRRQDPNFIPRDLIPRCLMADEDETVYWWGNTDSAMPTMDQFIEYWWPPTDDSPRVHMLWTDGPCWTTCWNGGFDWIDAMRTDRMEFIVAQHPWFENDCHYADILLPANTRFESTQFGHDTFCGNLNSAYIQRKALPVRGESVTDWEIVLRVCDKLGISREEAILHNWEGKDVEPTTDHDYWVKKGFEGSGMMRVPGASYDKFLAKDYVMVPIAEGWEDDHAGFYDFYVDPENNPLMTPSGKLEFYSALIAEFFPDETERMAWPHYLDQGPSHQESRQTKRAEEFEYVLISNHPHHRVHAQMDDLGWLREIQTCKVTGPDGYQYEPVWINPKEAEKLGVETGDVVKLYNERGWVLGGVLVTSRICEHAVYQDHGARTDIVCERGDRGGANNLIAPSTTTSATATGEVTSGYLVGVEKVDVFELAKQYPEGFNRQLDKGFGVSKYNFFFEGEVDE